MFRDPPLRGFAIVLFLIFAATIALTLQKGDVRQGALLTAVFVLLSATTLSAGQTAESLIEKFSDDFSEIADGLTSYLSVFDARSLPDTGTETSWLDIAPAAVDGSKARYAFDNPPMFSRESGVFMGGNNRLTGPKSDALGIAFHRTFSIVLVVKHGTLTVQQNAPQDQSIELLKLYANSPNNNGVCLKIQPASIKSVDNTQTGVLEIEYASGQPIACKADPAHSGIDLDKDMLTFYYIVKDTDHVRVLMMSQANDAVTTLATFPIPNDAAGVTLSNKEMVINRNLNWNGHLLTFAIYDNALTTEAVSEFHSHVLKRFYRHVDPNVPDLVKRYERAEAELKAAKSCPFVIPGSQDQPARPSDACRVCTNATWEDPMSWLTSAPNCKRAIADYCGQRSTDVSARTSVCRCWDASYPLYNSPACRMVRATLTEDSSHIWRDMDEKDLGDIKNRYGLVHASDCSPSSAPAAPEKKKESDAVPPATTVSPPHLAAAADETPKKDGAWVRFVKWAWP